jgi:hypothetical protein
MRERSWRDHAGPGLESGDRGRDLSVLKVEALELAAIDLIEANAVSRLESWQSGRQQERKRASTEQLPASRELAGVDARKAIGDRDASRWHPRAGCRVARRVELGREADEVGEARREADERDLQLRGAVRANQLRPA